MSSDRFVKLSEIPESGGVSGLEQDQILFGGTDGTISQDSDLKFDPITKSILKAVTADQQTRSGNAYFVGDSVAAGASSTSNSLRFSALVSAWLGLTENNLGVSGQSMISNTRSPGVLSGGYSLLDNASTIVPVYNAGTCALLSVVIGTNDVSINFPNWSAANFSTDYQSFLTYVHDVKGWPFDKILLATIPYFDPTTYAASYGGSALDQMRIDAFNTVISTLATTNGTMLADVYTAQKNNGGAKLRANYFHPNNEGHLVMAVCMLNSLLFPVQKNGQALAINGVTELSDLKLKDLTMLPVASSFKLGVDNTGRVGIVYGIRSGERIDGDLVYDGNIVPNNAALPPGFGSHDILLKQDSKIWGAWDPQSNYANYIQFIDGSAVMKLIAAFGINLNNTLKIKDNVLYVGSGAGTSPALKTGDVYLPQEAGIETGAGGFGYGRIVPFTIQGYTDYRNAWANGMHRFYISGGANSNEQHSAFIIFPDGSIKFALDDTSQKQDVGFEMSYNKGFLPPRLTSTQRDQLGSLLISAVGSGTTAGYTSATVIFTGGGGAGAAATATFSGGALQSLNLTNPGHGYKTFPTITLAGDGTGQPNIEGSTTLPEGLTIYNKTTHKLNIFNGTEWQEPTMSTAS